MSSKIILRQKTVLRSSLNQAPGVHHPTVSTLKAKIHCNSFPLASW